MNATGSISTAEDSRLWNGYVDQAFEPAKRKIGLGMVMKTIFARPYNPISYLNNKDNKLVGDKLWYAEKARWDNGEETPLWKLLPKINKPILLLSGQYDAIATPKEQQDAVELIPNAKLVIIPDCAHESFLGQPEKFQQTISHFIQPSRQ